MAALEIDATDEAVFDAAPLRVFRAIVSEMEGRTHWWAPHWSAESRGGPTAGQVGGTIAIAVQGRPTVRFSARTVEVAEPTKLRVAYFSGAFRGQGTWTFEHLDSKTRVRFHFQAQPHGWLHIALWLRPREAREALTHHQVMRLGFDGLKRHLEAESSG